MKDKLKQQPIMRFMNGPCKGEGVEQLRLEPDMRSMNGPLGVREKIEKFECHNFSPNKDT